MYNKQPDDLYNRAYALCHSSNYAEALQLFNRLASQNPDSPNALFGVAYALSKLGRHEEAIIPLRQLIKLEPNHYETRQLLCQCLMSLERTRETEAAVLAALKNWPEDHELHYYLAHIARVEERYNDAIAQFSYCLSLKPNTLRELDGLAYCYLRSGDAASALRACNHAVSLDPTNQRLVYNYMKLQHQLASSNTDPIEFVPDCEAVTKRGSTADDQYSEALTHFLNRRYEDAVLLLRDAIARRESFNDAWSLLGDCLTYAKQYDEAREVYLLMCQRWPAIAAYRYALGSVTSKLGNNADALHHCLAGLSLDPQNAQGRGDLGNCYQSLGQMENAIAEFKAAVSIDPTIPYLHLSLANALETVGEPDEACAEWAATIEHDRHNEGYAEIAAQSLRRYSL